MGDKHRLISTILVFSKLTASYHLWLGKSTLTDLNESSYEFRGFNVILSSSYTGWIFISTLINRSWGKFVFDIRGTNLSYLCYVWGVFQELLSRCYLVSEYGQVMGKHKEPDEQHFVKKKLSLWRSHIQCRNLVPLSICYSICLMSWICIKKVLELSKLALVNAYIEASILDVFLKFNIIYT